MKTELARLRMKTVCKVSPAYTLIMPDSNQTTHHSPYGNLLWTKISSTSHKGVIWSSYVSRSRLYWIVYFRLPILGGRVFRINYLGSTISYFKSCCLDSILKKVESLRSNINYPGTLIFLIESGNLIVCHGCLRSMLYSIPSRIIIIIMLSSLPIKNRLHM